MEGSPSTPSTTPRHLKRLSLNTSSPFSPVSPSSPLSKSNDSPGNLSHNNSPSLLTRSDSGRRMGSTTRSLRLSSSGPISSSSSPITTHPPSASSSSLPPQDYNSPTPQSRNIGSASQESPTSSRTTPRSAHSRRTSSISYAKSPTIGTLSNTGGGGGGDSAFSPSSTARGSPNPNINSHSSSRGSFESGRPRPSLDGLAETTEEQEEEKVEGRSEHERLEGGTAGQERKVEESIDLGSGSALGFVNTQATLIEQNTDLLSFIAKKERKCLDLREELKRHESELALLKKKWESIVARSFQQQQQQQQHSSSRHGPSQSISTVSSASPNTSPTPRSASLHPVNSSSTHSLDLSLLSTSFDASELLSSATDGESRHRSVGSDPQIEIPESVKAAGNWLGGALGRVLEAAVGMPPPTDAPGEVEGKRREREGGTGMLESLREEEEEEEEEGEEGLGDRRRESQASSIETESTSGSTEKQSTAASSVQEDDGTNTATLSQIKTSPLRRKPVQERSASPLSSSSARRLFTSPPPPASSASSNNNTFPPPASSASPSSSTTSPSHNRTRSSLSSFSDSWSSLNKKWTNLTESETFKNSKRATLGLVNTFEEGLTAALGPLEPPSLSPSMSREHSSGGGSDRRATNTSPFFGGGSPSNGHSPTPNESNGERRLTEVPISPMPGQALSGVFASWSKGSQQKEKEKREEKGKGKGKAKEESHNNGFDWSAFQDQKEGEEEVEDWPAW
ncbi:hypothetical protein JCM5350_006401 [Sporobolomyces pararoseus]